MKTFEIRAEKIQVDGRNKWITHFLIDGKDVNRETFFKERDEEKCLTQPK